MQENGMIPVSRSKTLSQQVADQLIELIVSGELPEGEQLPSERDLGARFDVSRTVVREAVQAIAAHGLVIQSQGRNYTIARPSGASLANTVRWIVRQMGSAGVANVSEVRFVLEGAICRIAAERATEEEKKALGVVCAELEAATDWVSAGHADVRFHRALAEMTGNHLFVVVLDSISGALLDVRRQGFRTDAAFEYAVQAHNRILDHVVNGDGSGAEAEMSRHVIESAKWLGP